MKLLYSDLHLACVTPRSLKVYTLVVHEAWGLLGSISPFVSGPGEIFQLSPPLFEFDDSKSTKSWQWHGHDVPVSFCPA